MIVNLISSPRNISTATMYAFANHGAFKVMDEPFYAYYLQLTGADHPGKAEIIQSQPTTVQGVLEWIQDSQKLNQHLFIKNMAHHLIDMDLNFLQDYTNVLLIRDPKQLITSFAKVIPNPNMSDIGVKRQYEIYQFLAERCIVLDSNEVLKNPENVFNKLFDNLEIPFSAAMMQWEPGAIVEDGVWAKYWYDNVHQSSGFSKKITLNPPFPKHCLALLEESMPYYYQLHQKAIKAD